MKSRRMVLCSAALLTLACGLAAAPWLSSASAAWMVEGPLYLWSGSAITNDWDDASNWTGPSGYPSAPAHSAVFATNSGTSYAVDLTTETIGGLRIEESVDFSGDSGTPTLTVEGLALDASDGAITVTFNDKLEFIANAP